tara:strand:+ start:24 stop:1286 length:1263 start_codon:yes stop_codon:yes gene_type:complete
MSLPNLNPKSTASQAILPATGAISNVAAALPYGVYASNGQFLSGASSQVSYVFKKLGGDVLDLEIKEDTVYAAYEEAVLEYSYLVNIHQSKNILSDVLGNTTGAFDHKGDILPGQLSSSLKGDHVSLKYPSFDFSYARRVADGISEDANVGGNQTVYSASINVKTGVQDYDLQSIVSALPEFSASLQNVNKNKILVKKVFYKTPKTMWRFYGYYGGLGVVGNMSTYGQYADDSTYEVIPPWHNKAQAMAYEDSLYTRTSHYSYELRNNKIRLFPIPEENIYDKIWFQFAIPADSWEEDTERSIGVDGINNINTLPFGNLPYNNINAIGKQWIRRFALSLCKETLGLIRSKFATLPIPGDNVTLNGEQLATQAREEQASLRDELKTVLDELTYSKLMEGDADLVENANRIHQKVPLNIFMG